jgi:DNA-binding transcriptional LysR family regulator
MPALANGVLGRFLAGFVRDKPNLYVALTGLSSSLVIEAVAAGQADIGYADSPVDRLGPCIESRPCPAVVALSVGHRLTAKRDFTAERFVSLEPGSLSAMRIYVALAGVSHISQIEARLSHTALTLVAQGTGACILDPAAYLDFIGEDVVIRHFQCLYRCGLLGISTSSAQPIKFGGLVQRTILDFL